MTNLAVMFGYVVALYWAGIMIYNRWHPDMEIPPLVEVHEPVFKIAVVVMGIFVWRILNRVYATACIYNVWEGLLAVPRLFVGNFVNFCATVIAIQRFVKAKISGKVPEWGKTEHAWPSEAQMRKYRRKLGDLLLERRLVTAEQLEQALAAQQQQGGKLGQILVDQGVLWEEDIIQVNRLWWDGRLCDLFGCALRSCALFSAWMRRSPFLSPAESIPMPSDSEFAI